MGKTIKPSDNDDDESKVLTSGSLLGQPPNAASTSDPEPRVSATRHVVGGPRLTASSSGHDPAETKQSLLLKPRYYRRPDEKESAILKSEDPEKLSAADRASLVDLGLKPSIVVSGVVLLQNEEHENMEGNPDMLKSLVQQRKGLLKCAVVIIAIIIAITAAWLIIPTIESSPA